MLNKLGQRQTKRYSKVSLNDATEAELQTLPGDRSSLKRRLLLTIVKRPDHFQSIDELVNVSGIGEKTLEKLREYIEL